MIRLGLPELIVIFLAVILLFGPKALPDMAASIARAIQQFRRAIQDAGDNEDERNI